MTWRVPKEPGAGSGQRRNRAEPLRGNAKVPMRPLAVRRMIHQEGDLGLKGPATSVVATPLIVHAASVMTPSPT